MSRVKRKRSSDPEYRRRIEGLLSRLGIKQVQLAIELDIDQSTVSGWGKSDDPSPDMLAKLADFAAKEGLTDDSEWFVSRIGLARQTILSIADKYKRAGHAKPRPGEVVGVAANETVYLSSSSMPMLPVPRSVIGDEKYASYVKATADQGIFRKGDFFVIDGSRTDLRTLGGSLLAIYRSKEQAELINAGHIEDRRLPEEARAWYGIFVGRVRRRFARMRDGKMYDYMVEESWNSYLSPKPLEPAIDCPREFVASSVSTTSGEKEPRPEIEKHLSILGQVVYWHRSDERRSARGRPKK